MSFRRSESADRPGVDGLRLDEEIRCYIDDYGARHPNVDIRITALPHQCMCQKFLTHLAAGETPSDLIILDTHLYTSLADLECLFPLGNMLGTDYPLSPTVKDLKYSQFQILVHGILATVFKSSLNRQR